MKKIYNSKILLFTITIPSVVVAFIYFKIFNIIQTELKVSNINYFKIFMIYLAVAGVGFTLIAMKNSISANKKEIHPYLAIAIFIIYFVFLFLFFANYTYIIPSSIPNYMLLGIRPGILILTMIMPAMMHSMLVVIDWSINTFKVSIKKDIISIIGIPSVWFILGNMFAKLNMPSGEIFHYCIVVIFVVSMVAFFFFLIRSIYLGLKRKGDIYEKYLGYIVLIGSLIGLSLNSGIGNFFGDFSYYLFFVIDIITCVLLIIPNIKNKQIRLIFFIAKAITFIFTLYFFVVFIPYLPLSIIGVIIFGLGLLLIVPSILLLVHVKSLWRDYTYLNKFYSKKTLFSLFIIGLSTMPIIFGGLVRNDKKNIEVALKYTYMNDLTKSDKVDFNLNALKRSIKNMSYMEGMEKNEFNFFDENSQIPYITPIYNYYVLDGLSLSKNKINNLNKVFFDKVIFDISNNNTRNNKNVSIKSISAETEYDSQNKLYKSVIHLDLKNNSRSTEEYNTTFELPEGSYISDYYLYVNGQKKKGLIADKRAANWLYMQNLKIRRDPGLLTYVGDNQINLKVYPFTNGEIRKTGIEIVHKKPITLTIDNKKVELETKENLNSKTLIDNMLNKPIIYPGAAYLSKEFKETLPKITRKPNYYFIMDFSEGDKEKKENYYNEINTYIKENNIQNDVKQIIALNYQEHKADFKKGWENEFENVKLKGGFFLERSTKKILYDNYIKHNDDVSIIIVVSDDIDNSVFINNFKDLDFIAPEGLNFYFLNNNQQLYKYSLSRSIENQKLSSIKNIENASVLYWKGNNGRNFYIKDNDEDSILLTEDNFNMYEDNLANNKWESGLLLKVMYMNYLINPQKRLENALAIVKNSINHNIMSPLTSFIVLENEAQEKVLKLKQEQILKSDKPIDIDDMVQMNEPSIILLVICILIIIVINNIKTKRMIVIIIK